MDIVLPTDLGLEECKKRLAENIASGWSLNFRKPMFGKVEGNRFECAIIHRRRYNFSTMKFQDNLVSHKGGTSIEGIFDSTK